MTMARLPVPASLLPKLLVAVLFIGILFQLTWTSTGSSIRRPNAHPVPTTLSDDSHSGEGRQPEWFDDAKKVGGGEDDDNETPPQYLSGKTSSAVISTTAFPVPSATPVVPELSSSVVPASSVLPAPPPDTHKEDAVDYSKILYSYGTHECMPAFDDKMKAAALERNRTCAKHAPFPTAETRRTGFASISTGKTADAYQKAIQSQMFASAVKGSSFHILCEELSDGAWNKIAFLLNLVMNEMLKPEKERLEWIMWIDRDAILLDPCRPLSSFLPPNTDEYKDVNLIYNKDGFGLNAGVFIFKVSDWATDLFNTILAFRYYRPDVELVLAEQTALEKIINEDKWKKNVVQVPWYWFNAYPDEEDSIKKYKEGLEPENLEWFRARKGDYVVHFAGDNGRSGSGRMPDWLNMLQEIGNVYEKHGYVRDVTEEVQKYWAAFKTGTLTEDQKTGNKWKPKSSNAAER